MSPKKRAHGVKRGLLALDSAPPGCSCCSLNLRSGIRGPERAARSRLRKIRRKTLYGCEELGLGSRFCASRVRLFLLKPIVRLPCTRVCQTVLTEAASSPGLRSCTLVLWSSAPERLHLVLRSQSVFLGAFDDAIEPGLLARRFADWARTTVAFPHPEREQNPEKSCPTWLS
jgi:hypothetical protein